MDTDDSGDIVVEEFFQYINEPQTRFAEIIFKFLDTSGDGVMDFQEFLKVLSTWCMFGSKEILQFCFGVFDTDGDGFLVQEEIKELMVSNAWLTYIFIYYL